MDGIEILQGFRPVLSAEAHDAGGHEVIGWVHCPRWRAILGWLPLLIDRNMHGCIPYETNPEPWPHYYEGIEAAEMSQFAAPWYWGGAQEQAALIALARTLKDVRQVYPQASPQQIEDVLIELGVL